MILDRGDDKPSSVIPVCAGCPAKFSDGLLSQPWQKGKFNFHIQSGFIPNLGPQQIPKFDQSLFAFSNYEAVYFKNDGCLHGLDGQLSINSQTLISISILFYIGNIISIPPYYSEELREENVKQCSTARGEKSAPNPYLHGCSVPQNVASSDGNMQFDELADELS